MMTWKRITAALKEFFGVGWSRTAITRRRCPRCDWPHAFSRWHEDSRQQHHCANCGKELPP